MHRLLAIQAAALGLPVAAMGVDHVIVGDEMEPHVEGHGWILQVILEPAARLQHNVLDDVAGIQACGQGWIQPPADPLAQGFTMLGQQALHGAFIAFLCFLQQGLGLQRIWPHTARTFLRT